jgi:hypothetical protein
VYAFYSRLINLFPDVERIPGGELDACPWASGIDIAADHVILAIQLEQAPKIIGQIVSLAAQYELVSFDPQAGKVYLPIAWRRGRRLGPRPQLVLAALGRGLRDVATSGAAKAAAASGAGSVGTHTVKKLRTLTPGQRWPETVSDTDDGFDVPIEVYA